MDSKDAQGCLERGGGDARCSCSSARRNVAAVFVIQSLLTAMCAAFSLYIFFIQTSESNKQNETGIYLDMTREEFTAIWNKRVDLKDKKKVVISCTGPYIVYLWACVRSLDHNGMTANLTMQQGNKIVYQHTLRGDAEEVYQETQSVVMLSKKSEVTFKLEQFNTDIRILHLGLHYMLGAQCFPDVYDES